MSMGELAIPPPGTKGQIEGHESSLAFKLASALRKKLGLTKKTKIQTPKRKLSNSRSASGRRKVEQRETVPLQLSTFHRERLNSIGPERKKRSVFFTHSQRSPSILTAKRQLVAMQRVEASNKRCNRCNVPQLSLF